MRSFLILLATVLASVASAFSPVKAIGSAHRRTYVTMKASSTALAKTRAATKERTRSLSRSRAEQKAKISRAKKSVAMERDADKQAEKMSKVGDAILAAIDDKAAYDNAGYAMQNKKLKELRLLAQTAPKSWDTKGKKEYEKQYAEIVAKYDAESEIIRAGPSPDECAIDDRDCQVNAITATKSIARVSNSIAKKKPKVIAKVNKEEAEENASVLYLSLGAIAVAASVGLIQRKLAAAALAAQSSGQSTLALALAAVAVGGVALTFLGSDTSAAPAKAQPFDVGVVEPTSVVAPTESETAAKEKEAV